MKKHFFKLTIVLASVIFLYACDNSGSTEKKTGDTTAASDVNIGPNPSSTLPDSNSNKMNPDIANTTPNEFVTKVAQGSMAEIAMGKLAQTNAANEDVKEYGRMLEKDHGDVNAKLKDIATAEKITWSTGITDEQLKHINHLEGLKGADFDKAFIPMMIDGHAKNIAEFKTAAAGNSNQKIKDFAAATLPTLQTHLDKAKTIKGRIK